MSNEPEPAQEPVEPTEPDPVPQEPEYDHEAENVSLRALIAKWAPDADLDAEMDNIAFKRDGTAIYIGDYDPTPAPTTKKVITRSSQRSQGTTTPNVSKMSIEERSKHLDKMLAI